MITMMKTIISIFACMVLLQCSPYNTECVILNIGAENSVKLAAITIDGGIKEEDLCDNTIGEYHGKLLLHGGSLGTERLLTKGTLILNGKEIELDVSGLACPWVEKSDMTPEACTLDMCECVENKTTPRRDYYHILTIRFYKGGCNDYQVTWFIYRNKSIRTSIEDAGG